MRQELSIPFEKNQYFYGKLLSVEDFLLEQKYGDDKRRLTNRLIHGSGIVTGLYVTLVDEQTISVEKGVALDQTGREIVVDVAVMKKLSMLEGFEQLLEEEAKGPVYLCLAYDETASVPVHNITKNVPDTINMGEADYSRIQENYRLYLTSQEPSGENLSALSLYEEVITVYQENGIRIRQKMPRYAESGKTAVLFVEVETRDRRNLTFSYDIKLKGLSWEGLSKITVNFDEILFEKTGHYEICYLLTASEVNEGTGIALIDEKSGNLCLSMERQNTGIKGKMELMIGGLDPKEALIRNYYRMPMEEVMKPHSNQPIYLARFYLILAGDTYLIDELERVPYGQYVRNLALEQALDHMAAQEKLEKGGDIGAADRSDGNKGKWKDSNSKILIRGGNFRLPLREGAQKGEKYISGDISHGLGLGKTVILLGLEEEESLWYGSPGVFDGKRPDVMLAAKVNTATGTFAIGAKLSSPTTEKELNIQWTAIRDARDTVIEQEEMRLFIKPGVLELKVRESCVLEVQCENMEEKAVLWSVSFEGGTVDANGLYTAPNLPGVYEITASSAAFPKIRASLFAVVREYGAESAAGE